MNILTVSHFYEAHGGGLERVAGHLCRQFAHLGAKPLWAASSGDRLPTGDIEAVPLRCLNLLERFTGLPIPLPGLRAVRTLMRAVRRCDAVVIHDALYATSILAMVMAKMHGKPVVLVQHIAAIPFSSRTLRFAMSLANFTVTRPMLWAASARVFISATVRHDLLGTPARHACRLLFNGVDSSIFYPEIDPQPATNLPVDITASADMRRILFVGRYVEKKGLSVLRALAVSRPDLLFLLAGHGPLRPAQWGCSNVRDLGVLAPETLAELYRRVDLLFLPSVGEGYPLVIQEAMACGLPAVCGAPTHRADPDATGWLRGVVIELTDPQGSAHRCAEAIDSVAFCASERAAMARYAKANYSWQTMAQGVLALIHGDKGQG